MNVSNYMSRRVVSVTPDTPVILAAKLMLDHKISGLPVVDRAGRLVGIVSEHDLLRQRDGNHQQRPHWLQLMTESAGLNGERTEFRERKVSEVMTPDPVTVSADSSLEEACRLIEERGIKRLPVVMNGKLVGIIARADLVRALARTMAVTGPAGAPDVSVQEQLRELERQMWRTRARIRKPF
jgi:CBS domain-containing protein